ncbi:MAG: sodium/solute symporter [Kiritimatiellae bacterium]|nr:sodium/solute symporter [Kiritimatiellia bacterium]
MMNIHTPLTGLDFVVIAIYFALVLSAGMFMGKFVKSSKDFFSGGKKVPWWMGAISSYMAMISSFVFIAHAGVAYQDGLVAILVFWSTVVGVVLGSWIFAWRWQRAQVTTPMEYLERRYGSGVRQFISWCGIGFRVLDNMVRLYSLGLIASVLLNIPLSAGIWLGVVIVLAYTLTGGLWSVLVTDVIQCTILFSAAVAMLFLSLHEVGGLGALAQTLPDHFNAFNGHRGSFMFLFAYYLIVFIKYNGNWAFIQRLESVPDERSAIKMGLLTAVLLLLFPVVALLPAIAARHLLPGVNPEEAYLTLCTKLLPPGALGLMVSAMLAATLSTLASEFNVTSSVFSKDIYQRLMRPQAGAKEMLLVGRLGMVAVATLVAVGSQFVTALGGAFEANKLLMGLFGVPIVIPSVFGILWKKPNTAGVYACIVAGVLAGLAFNVVFKLKWEWATVWQVAACLLAYVACGWLCPTSAAEQDSKDGLFRELARR